LRPDPNPQHSQEDNEAEGRESSESSSLERMQPIRIEYLFLIMNIKKISSKKTEKRATS
jgi:hypothetical protein